MTSDEKITIKLNRKIQLSQQRKTDEIHMYKVLAKMAESKAEKRALVNLVNDQKKNLAILKSYTNKRMRPRKIRGLIYLILYRFSGRSVFYLIIAMKKIMSLPRYRKLSKKYPDIKEIVKSESIGAKVTRKLVR